MNPSLPGQPAADRESLLFYWEFDSREQAHHQARATVDEGYLAEELNHGNRLLRVRRIGTEVPDFEALPPVDAGIDLYSDAVAAILQVAAWRGLDMKNVIEDALESVEHRFFFSERAADRRLR